MPFLCMLCSSWFLVLPYWECHTLNRTVCSDSHSPVLAFCWPCWYWAWTCNLSYLPLDCRFKSYLKLHVKPRLVLRLCVVLKLIALHLPPQSWPDSACVCILTTVFCVYLKPVCLCTALQILRQLHQRTDLEYAFPRDNLVYNIRLGISNSCRMISLPLYQTAS